MNALINTLIQRYQDALEHAPMDESRANEYRARLNALRLARAVQLKLNANESAPGHPLQFGILGPTQAGKSTLVHLLLNRNAAGVSALAGYTVHAQGFVTDEHAMPAASAVTTQLFSDYQLTHPSDLDHDSLQQYSLVSAEEPTHLLPDEPSVIWDSPDFDSIESRGYRSAVLRVVALADVVILMTSKDKYADRSVWDMLRLIEPLGKPMLVCINKLNPEDADAVIQSFLQRYRDYQTVAADGSAAPVPVIVPIPYIRGLNDSADALAAAVGNTLSSAIQSVTGDINRHAQTQGANRFIQHHINDWLAPAKAEQQAFKVWEQAISDGLDKAMKTYQQSYLQHPQKYDTFNRAIAELLSLLEIPGLASALGTTRTVVTWPVRTLFKLGKSAISSQKAKPTGVPIEFEDEILQLAQNHLHSELIAFAMDQAADQPEQALWWRSIAQQLREERPMLDVRFKAAVDDYQAAFAPEVEKSAKKLYSSLQEQPALLNGLRAFRVSTDAAAVVLAVKSGGLAASDLLIAPATLGLTSMLTEGALGRYMESVRSDLMVTQEKRVRDTLFDGLLRPALKTLGRSPSKPGLFNLSEADMPPTDPTLPEGVEPS